MKDYMAKITVNVNISAKNMDQASERADILSEQVNFDELRKKKPWVGDIDYYDADATELE